MLLLDTNVVSELRKVRLGKADPNVAQWAETLDTASLFISVITVHELEIGVLQIERRDPRQGTLFRAWLETHVLPAFADRILAVDGTIARRAARLHVPDPQPINDMLIAATALVHGMVVVTCNVADFAPVGVPLLNPWEAVPL
ncbi:type II toxin-antitoxin system VapC family toxin [Reyranella sp. CPCC 100927]|uniref:type II toxin-antitoxin system VapC family toxin n=1 Tax=Reyranella sp. CPCC 100927 TaxID=2599616 RepID=UPI0011B5C7D7|nr:type II toxin-antitoxin system VapC family toxin [Reyranella sp. CPCC 100927]TWT10697.1 type II toxin-antitoxin system VapC family toxin [Reyranella sp. CPCC 100927]